MKNLVSSPTSPLLLDEVQKDTDFNGYDAQVRQDNGSVVFINFGPCSASPEEDIAKGTERYTEDETEGDGPYRPESVPVEDFLAALSLQSVMIDLNTGSFAVGYTDGMLFAGHTVGASITGAGQIEHSGIEG